MLLKTPLSCFRSLCKHRKKLQKNIINYTPTESSRLGNVLSTHVRSFFLNLFLIHIILLFLFRLCTFRHTEICIQFLAILLYYLIFTSTFSMEQISSFFFAKKETNFISLVGHLCLQLQYLLLQLMTFLPATLAHVCFQSGVRLFFCCSKTHFVTVFENVALNFKVLQLLKYFLIFLLIFFRSKIS